jgi:hypothetical protein
MASSANLRIALTMFLTVLICTGCHHPHAWQPVPHAPSIQQPKADFSLVWDKEDANGAPLNPYWGLEKTQNEIPPREVSQHPYPCELDPYSNSCTENKGLVLDPPRFPNDIICKVGNPSAKFNGHADWMVASQLGCAQWEDQSADADYNFQLFPPDRLRSIVTKNNDQSIGTEFDYFETIVNSGIPFWTQLRSEVQRENDDQRSHEPEIRQLLNPSKPGVNPRVAVVGLFGVDCEHGCKSEIHPVLAFAIETNATADDDTWVMFVRNWGDEGFCSRYRHFVEFPNNTISLLLFDDGTSVGPTIITDKTRMFASGTVPIDFPVISYWQAHGPVISFSLPDPVQTRPYLELEVHFKWKTFTAPSCAPTLPRLVRAESIEQSLDAETYLRNITRKAIGETPESARLFEEVKPKPTASLVEVAAPSSIGVQIFVPPSQPSVRKLAKLPIDPDETTRNTKNLRSVCKAYKNQLPLYQGQDISSQLCNEQKLSKELQTNQ